MGWGIGGLGSDFGRMGVPLGGAGDWRLSTAAIMARDYMSARYVGTQPTVSRASAGNYAQNVDGSWTSFAANTIRAGSKGVPLEEERTSWCKNGAPSGQTISAGVALTPGFASPPLPTGWLLNEAGGSTETYFPSGGTSMGLDYVDWRMVNPTIASAQVESNFYWNRWESAPIPATNADTFVFSAFCVGQAGSWSNISPALWYAATEEYPVGGVQIDSHANFWGFPFHSSNFGASRMSVAVTPVDAACIEIGLDSQMASLAVVGSLDNTLRIGMFSIEKVPTGSMAAATTPIRTTGIAGSTVRNADLYTTAYSGALTGVIFAATTAPGIGSLDQVLGQRDDGTPDNRIYVVRDSSRHLRLIVIDGGVEQVNLDMGVVLDNTSFMLAAKWATNDFAAVLNGGTEVTDTSGTVPTGLTTIRTGHDTTGNHWNGLVAREEWIA